MIKSNQKNFIKNLAFILSLFSFVACSNPTASNTTSSLSGNSDNNSSEVEYNKDVNPLLFNFSFENTSTIKNCLQGKIKLTGFDDKVKSISLFWGDDEKVFQNYSAISSFEDLSSKEVEYTFSKNYAITYPERRIFIQAYDKDKNLIDTGSIAVDKYKDLKENKKEIQIISDQQISGFQAFYRRSKNTFIDIKENSPKSEAIFVNGDIVDEAKDSNYVDFYKSFDQAYEDVSYTPDLNISLGNHEFILHSETSKVDNFSTQEKQTRYNDRLKMWKTHTGNESIYGVKKYENIPFINLGTVAFPNKLDGNSQADATLGDEQLKWLDDTLKSIGKDKTIFLLSHGSLRNTVSGSLTSLGQSWYGYSESEEKKLRDIISDYPNLLFFSSHSHWCFESEKPYLIDENSSSFFNTAAIGYLWQGEGGGRHYSINQDYENDGAQGLYVELYDDQLIIRGRQFEDRDGISKYWYSPYQVVLPLRR